MMEATEENEDTMEVLPSTETENDTATASKSSTVTDEQWRAMKSMLEEIYAYREEDGHDPSKVFHKRVNKRNLPAYYEVIKEPVALSVLKVKITNREYENFAAFVRDCALIWHNAHTYNRPDAGAYQDASTIKKVMEAELQKLVDQKIVTPELAAWPDLGEIPPVEDVPDEEEDEEDEDEDEEEEDDEEEADNSDEDSHKRRRRGRPSISGSRRDTLKAETSKGELMMKKKRGRPPKVDTPMEARIKNVLKAIRKPRSDDGLLIHSFEKLPDKLAMPEYYAEIKHPIAIEQIKKNQKRKRYTSVDHFMRDIDLMFENAKLFNEDDSQIYKDAVYLQQEAHRSAEIEKKKADTDFIMEEGRKPRPGGILHMGELYKVGDWVHIQNPNDVTKPIVSQIYRTWEDSDGQEWVNACWYYRPEQTVHHFEKHFYPNEVVKTGQYRDHRIDEVVGRCFVMFFTRYSRGRPRGLAPDAEVYVCEARYNEEKHKINKIKTWASCLPDEVRDKDYEMNLFDQMRRVKKVPSPLLYMLDEGKVTEEAPQPRWGVENAPPLVGGIYKGPREDNQSPPPEPTPEPAPPTPQPAARQTSATPSHDMSSSYEKAQEYLQSAGRAFGAPPNQIQSASRTTEMQASRPHQQASASPAPQQYQTPQPSSSQNPASTQAFQSPQAQQSSFQAVPTPPLASFGTPLSRNYPQTAPQPSRSSYGPPPGVGFPAQRSSDAYVLPDSANAAIPKEVREQYHCDEEGRVIFFTKPPLDLLPPDNGPATTVVGHSIKFRAARLRRNMEREKREKERKEAAKAKITEEETSREREAENTATNYEQAATDLANTVASQLCLEMTGQPLEAWLAEHAAATSKLLRASLPGAAQAMSDAEFASGPEKLFYEEAFANVRAGVKREREEVVELEERKRKWAEAEREMWKGPKVYKDDVNPWWLG